MIQQNFINLLLHLSRRLDALKAEITDAIQARDPSLLHPPIKALTIAKEINDTMLHEIKPFSQEEHDTSGWLEILEDLQIDFSVIVFTIQDGLPYCFIDGTISYLAQIEEYRVYCTHLANKAINKIKGCLDPIIRKQLEELHAEHGEPMAIAMPPYRPWDAPPEPVPEYIRMFRESCAAQKAPAALLVSITPPLTLTNMEAGHLSVCTSPKGIDSKKWPMCCNEAMKDYVKGAKANGWE